MIVVDIVFPPAAPAMWAAEGEAESANLGINIAVDTAIAMSHIPDYGFPSQNAAQTQTPAPTRIPCPKIPILFTAIHKRQAHDKEPTGMNSQIPGSASIDPRQLGYDYPGPEDQSKAALDQRDQSMRKFRQQVGSKSPILIYPQGPLPKNWPKPPYTVRGVGDKNVRNSQTMQADIRLNNNKTQFKTTLPAVVIVPPGFPCPKGSR